MIECRVTAVGYWVHTTHGCHYIYYKDIDIMELKKKHTPLTEIFQSGAGEIRWWGFFDFRSPCSQLYLTIITSSKILHFGIVFGIILLIFIMNRLKTTNISNRYFSTFFSPRDGAAFILIDFSWNCIDRR